MRHGPSRAATRIDAWSLLLLSACASLAAFLHYFRNSQILLYGDAVAHMAIARRVFDSLTPGFSQLGSVWLPLPHLLMVPFVYPDQWWQNGVGGSIPSMGAYCAATVGILRLVRSGLARARVGTRTARVAAWFAALIFAANPNLLYLQTTAMTEPVYLALFIWAVVFLQDFVFPPESTRPSTRALFASALCLCGAELTRYDGWFAAPFFFLVVLSAAVRHWRRSAQPHAAVAAGVLLFSFLTAAGPAWWAWQNYSAQRDPLAFMRGPYSAKAIEARTSPGPAPHHPGDGNARLAGRYFLIDATLNLGEYPWRRLLLVAAVAGTIAALILWPGSALWLLLWLPLPFYTYSIARGSIPIFMPVLPPWSYYNVRYGVELLPAIAVFAAIAAVAAWEYLPFRRAALLIPVAALGLVAATYASAYRQPGFRWSYLPGEPQRGPVAWRGAVVNARTRQAFERKLADALRTLPDNATLLMYTGDHVGALQDAGIDLDHVISESNYGWWTVALMAPAHTANYTIAMAGDPVDAAVHDRPQGLCPVTMIESEGQPRTTIFRACLQPEHR